MFQCRKNPNQNLTMLWLGLIVTITAEVSRFGSFLYRYTIIFFHMMEIWEELGWRAPQFWYDFLSFSRNVREILLRSSVLIGEGSRMWGRGAIFLGGWWIVFLEGTVFVFQTGFLDLSEGMLRDGVWEGGCHRQVGWLWLEPILVRQVTQFKQLTVGEVEPVEVEFTVWCCRS